MRVLFVCRSNAERSPIAEYLFGRYTKANTAMSAGTNVSAEGAVGWGLGRVTTELLCDLGFFGALRKRRRQVTPAMLRSCDKAIVIMNGPGERAEFLPRYLAASHKVTPWDLRTRINYEAPTHSAHIARLMEIDTRTRKLVNEIG